MAGEAGFMEAMQGAHLLAALKIERKKLDYETSRVDPTDPDRVVRVFLSQSPHPDSIGCRTRLFGWETLFD
jgi:hypothetical protein